MSVKRSLGGHLSTHPDLPGSETTQLHSELLWQEEQQVGHQRVDGSWGHLLLFHRTLRVTNTTKTDDDFWIKTTDMCISWEHVEVSIPERLE